MTDTGVDDAPTEQAAPGSYAVPQGRGRWRVTLHKRGFTYNSWMPVDTGLTELVDATDRKLTTAINEPATFTFTLDGRSPHALETRELMTDVIAWRWDDQTGQDVPMFFGIITGSQDTVNAESHTVDFICRDYLFLLQRRIITDTTPLIYTQVDQDDIAASLLTKANNVMRPGSFTPLIATDPVNPDGSDRPQPSGQVRDRTYFGNSKIGELIDQLSSVINGFDYDASPRVDQHSSGTYLRVFYPRQGADRTDISFEYGASVSSVQRTVTSSDYANYIRSIGESNTDETAPQLASAVWNADASNVSTTPIGLWMLDDAASDVILKTTLDERVYGLLADYGGLRPSYTLDLRPGAYAYGSPNMGDTVPVVIQSGRLDVATNARVLGIDFDIGDDGDEDVSITVDRPTVTLSKIFAKSQRQLNALARR